MGTNIGITEHENDTEGYPSEDRIKIVNEYPFEDRLHTTMLHELGHAIRLAHLPAGYLMYAGQPLPTDPIEAEVKAAVLYLSLPNGIDTRIYDSSAP